jgi:hypothetical protein
MGCSHSIGSREGTVRDSKETMMDAHVAPTVTSELDVARETVTDAAAGLEAA